MLFSFEGTAFKREYGKSGDNSREDTPVPIPNTEVKLSSAEDTWREAAWEIRTSPVFSFFEIYEQGCSPWVKENHRENILFLFEKIN